MVVEKRRDVDPQGGIYRPPPLRRSANNDAAQPPLPQHQTREPEKDKETPTSVKPKRPDREVYVPRQRRANSSALGGKEDSTASPNSAIEGLAPRRIRSSNKAYCNVYTPPHLRASLPSAAVANNQNSDERTTNVITDSSSVVKRPVTRKRQLSEDGSNCVADSPANIEHIDYSADDTKEHMIDSTSMSENVMNMTHHNIINNENIAHSNNILWSPNNKDEDGDQTELERATQEINRSNRRLIKQSFVSDVLIISDPLEEDRTRSNKAQEYREIINNHQQQNNVEHLENSIAEDKNKKDVFNAEEEEWEAMLGEDGECLEPSLLAELNNAVGRVTIQTPRTAPFRPGPDKDPFSHVLEVYNFPAQFTTNDLLSVFAEFKDTGFEIKWVDDNHALAVFSSARIAEDVLAYNHPMVRTRPLHEGTQESRQKAKRCAEFLQPYRTRPETCPALARRLVTGALGVRLPTMSQERIQEKKVLSEFKEKRRIETQMREKLREAAWDGSLGNTNEGS